MRKWAAILATALLCVLSGCRGQEADENFTLDEDIRLEIAGSDKYRFNSYTDQLYFNRGEREFRVGTDTMSDYFTLRVNQIPAEEGQSVTATVTWTTSTSIESRKNVALRAVKLEGDKIWLWDSRSGIGAVVRILD